MPEVPVYFFSENIRYTPLHKKLLKSWLLSSAGNEGFTILALNYIFCDDPYLLFLNQKYLEHDTLTDIITFDNRNKDERDKNFIEGDIFISYERVKENARKYEVNLQTELKRVMIHGLLHLAGYKDKRNRDKEKMREREDFYLGRAEF
jgi:probable rRNA maturation factor